MFVIMVGIVRAKDHHVAKCPDGLGIKGRFGTLVLVTREDVIVDTINVESSFPDGFVVGVMYHHPCVSNHSPSSSLASPSCILPALAQAHTHLFFTANPIDPIGMNHLALIQPVILWPQSLKLAVRVCDLGIGMKQVFGRAEEHDGLIRQEIGEVEREEDGIAKQERGGVRRGGQERPAVPS